MGGVWEGREPPQGIKKYVCILAKMANHFLRNPYTRPRILSDRIPIHKNPGTFGWIPQKVVGHFFERVSVYTQTHVTACTQRHMSLCVHTDTRWGQSLTSTLRLFGPQLYLNFTFISTSTLRHIVLNFTFISSSLLRLFRS